MMRRVAVLPPGAEQRFVPEEVPEPVPGPGQLVVRTEAVGVSLGLVRLLASDSVPPEGPGGEMVGHVTGLGPGVEGYAVGDRVGGVVFGGLYAESVLALPTLVSHVPAGAEVGAGPALAVVRGGLVALSALRAGRFTPGESVLVTAAASGTGHLAVQLARALGASRVVAAVGSPDKAEFAFSCGADEVVGYDGAAWGDPFDLVLDGVGGPLVQRAVDALAPYGRVVAFSAGGGSVEAGSLLGGLKTVTGFSVGLISREHPELLDERRAELWALLSAGKLRPACTQLPLAAITDAVSLVATRANRGRVLLTTR